MGGLGGLGGLNPPKSIVQKTEYKNIVFSIYYKYKKTLPKPPKPFQPPCFKGKTVKKYPPTTLPLPSQALPSPPNIIYYNISHYFS